MRLFLVQKSKYLIATQIEETFLSRMSEEGCTFVKFLKKVCRRQKEHFIVRLIKYA